MGVVQRRNSRLKAVIHNSCFGVVQGVTKGCRGDCQNSVTCVTSVTQVTDVTLMTQNRRPQPELLDCIGALGVVPLQLCQPECQQHASCRMPTT